MPLQPSLWNAQEYRKEHPDSGPRIIDPVLLPNLQELMEVKIRSNGEYFKVRVDQLDDNKIIGTVVTEVYPEMPQPFKQYDVIEFYTENIVDIVDIPKVGIIL